MDMDMDIHFAAALPNTAVLLQMASRNPIAVLESALVVCVRCGSPEHRSQNCDWSMPPVCVLCGNHEHHTLQCDLAVCSRCGDVGHERAECRTRVCCKCFNRGHVGDKCRHVCAVCGERGQHCSFFCPLAA